MRPALVRALRKIAYDETTPRDKLDSRDLAGLIPLVGGVAHGAIKPAEGTSRAESAVVQGGVGALGGLAGGMLGALGGAGAGGAIGAMLTDRGDRDQRTLVALAGLGSVMGTIAGASVGTFGGSLLGRTLGRRDVLTATDLKRLGAMQAG